MLGIFNYEHYLVENTSEWDFIWLTFSAFDLYRKFSRTLFRLFKTILLFEDGCEVKRIQKCCQITLKAGALQRAQMQ